MSDLDFDELDKAVTTLMGDVPRVDLSKADEVKTLSINSTLSGESRPSLAKLDSELARVNQTEPSSVSKSGTVPTAPPPSLATRRGGRFMDVVHPSSDMKGVTRQVAPMSRQGVTIEPAAAVAPAQTIEKNVDFMTDAVKAIDTSAANEFGTIPDVSDSREIPKDEWPDPLDLSGYTSEPDTSSIAEAVPANVSTDTLVVDESEDDDAQLLVSPFLAGAKVEKRPLGGAPVDEVKENVDNRDEELGRVPVLGSVTSDDAAEQLPVDPTMLVQHLPPELQSDLMAIETDGGTSSNATRAHEGESSPVEKQEEKKLAEPADLTAVEKPVSESAPSVAATLTGPTSIPQQYHEAPTTSDQASGSIYDTDSYHQPLAHPAKVASGWLWIVWILLLLMVGGGGAVALYFTGII